jgi:glycosyltransferase involved in cell wall biosynthesis
MSRFEACAQAGLPLTVVGTGPERARLEALAGPAVRFAGRVTRERLRELYRSAEMLLQPGLEDFGIATAEALACGTPVLALGQGGVLDIVREGEHGLFFGHDEAPEIRAAIDKMRGMQFNSMNLRERAEDFSAERFARRVRALLGADWPDAEDLFA